MFSCAHLVFMNHPLTRHQRRSSRSRPHGASLMCGASSNEQEDERAADHSGTSKARLFMNAGLARLSWSGPRPRCQCLPDERAFWPRESLCTRVLVPRSAIKQTTGVVLANAHDVLLIAEHLGMAFDRVGIDIDRWCELAPLLEEERHTRCRCSTVRTLLPVIPGLDQAASSATRRTRRTGQPR